jgi:diguanylate cyclase
MRPAGTPAHQVERPFADNHRRMDADLFADAAPVAAEGWRPRVGAFLARQAWPEWLGSLKLRIAAGGTVALLLGIAVTAWQLTGHAERDLLRQAHEREAAQARWQAANLGARVRHMNMALDRAAAQWPAASTDAAALVRLLEVQLLPGTLFTNAYAAAADGRLLVHVDAAGARYPNVSIADRDYFRETLIRGAITISGPIDGRVSGEPEIVFSRPVVRHGTVVAIIGGALNLAGHALLDRPAPSEAAAPGLVVVTDSQGRILSHPERRRIARPLWEDPRLAEAFRAWRAAGRPLDGTGFEPRDGDIVVSAGEAQAGWQVWRSAPQAPVLEPLLQARRLALRDAGVLAVILIGAMLALLVWQLKPLRQLEQRAAALLAGDDVGDWPRTGGEIGRLARTLHHVWAERRQVESFNSEVLRKLGSVMSAAPVGLAFTRDERLELVSSELCRLLGCAEAELLGQQLQGVFASGEDFASLRTKVAEAFARREPYAGEWQLRHADGSAFWARLRARPVAADDPAAGMIWSINDVSDQVQALRRLEHAAHHDALTGLVNRQGFERALQSVFEAQPGSRPAAVVMIDLDHFKPINDSAGHAAGDAMLVAVAQAIASRVRGSDLVCRLGGDEFAVLLPGCPHDRALAVAEKVRLAITTLALTWETHTLRVGASLGVADLGEQHDSAAQWVAQADAACYEAKRSGRGMVRVAGLRVVGG